MLVLVFSAIEISVVLSKNVSSLSKSMLGLFYRWDYFQSIPKWESIYSCFGWMKSSEECKGLILSSKHKKTGKDTMPHLFLTMESIV